MVAGFMAGSMVAGSMVVDSTLEASVVVVSTEDKALRLLLTLKDEGR